MNATANMVRFAEYGSVDRSKIAVRTVLEHAPGHMHGTPDVRLVHSTPGFEPAGSLMRWTDEKWLVLHDFCDAEHGRFFTSRTAEADARALFAELTDTQKVSATRQRAAQAEDERRERLDAEEARDGTTASTALATGQGLLGMIECQGMSFPIATRKAASGRVVVAIKDGKKWARIAGPFDGKTRVRILLAYVAAHTLADGARLVATGGDVWDQARGEAFYAQD